MLVTDDQHPCDAGHHLLGTLIVLNLPDLKDAYEAYNATEHIAINLGQERLEAK